jgi:hypothetical protein
VLLILLHSWQAFMLQVPWLLQASKYVQVTQAQAHPGVVKGTNMLLANSN